MVELFGASRIPQTCQLTWSTLLSPTVHIRPYPPSMLLSIKVRVSSPDLIIQHGEDWESIRGEFFIKKCAAYALYCKLRRSRAEMKISNFIG